MWLGLGMELYGWAPNGGVRVGPPLEGLGSGNGFGLCMGKNMSDGRVRVGPPIEGLGLGAVVFWRQGGGLGDV